MTMTYGKRLDGLSLFVGATFIGAIGVLVWGVGQSITELKAPVAEMPAGLKALEGNGLSVDAVESPVDGMDAWVIHTPAEPGSTAQLAISAPGSDGFAIGELFTEAGTPVSDDLIGSDARLRLRYHNLGIVTQWLPVTQGATRNSVYLFASPLDPQMQALWQVIDAHRDQLPQIRLVPTAYGSPDSFEAVLDIFLAPHEIGGNALTSRNRLLDYLGNQRQIPEALRDNATPNPAAVDALSSNGNIHHRLRLDTQPTVVAPAKDGGLSIQTLTAYLEEATGVSAELADDNRTASNNHQG